MEAYGEHRLPNRSSNGFGDAAVLAGVPFWRGVMSNEVNAAQDVQANLNSDSSAKRATKQSAPKELWGRRLTRSERQCWAQGFNAAPVAAAPVECGNCHDGKSDMDHDCLKCSGSGVLPSTSAAPRIDLHAPCTEAVYALARKLLWIAYVWNDHNFDHPYKIARALAQEFGIESFDQANAWLDEQANLIDASPKGQ